MYYIYILKCYDNSYYTGITNNLKKRLKFHNSGKGARYTSKRLPCRLIWFEKSQNRSEALSREFEIKKFSRKKKERLIFAQNTVWQHYKGGRYIILDQINDIIINVQLGYWEKYYNNRKEAGNQCEAYARDKDQWLDWIDKDNEKVLRFSRITKTRLCSSMVEQRTHKP